MAASLHAAVFSPFNQMHILPSHFQECLEIFKNSPWKGKPAYMFLPQVSMHTIFILILASVIVWVSQKQEDQVFLFSEASVIPEITYNHSVIGKDSNMVPKATSNLERQVLGLQRTLLRRKKQTNIFYNKSGGNWDTTVEVTLRTSLN